MRIDSPIDPIGDEQSLYEAWLESSQVGRVSVKFVRDRALLTVNQNCSDAFLFFSLMQIALWRLETELIKEDVIVTTGPLLGFDLSALGFVARSGWLEKSVLGSTAVRLTEIRRLIDAGRKLAPRLGKGYLVDISRLKDQDALAMLNDRYNAIAWGEAGWAHHADVAADEKRIVESYVVGKRALEVGVGSGRVTSCVAKKVESLTAIDSVPEVVHRLKPKEKGESFRCFIDDIRQSTLSGEFDCVVWWENGLGGILRAKDRKKALGEVARLLSPGGRAILGLRTLLSFGVDHLMPSSRCADVFGIYHTFSPSELIDLLPSDLSIETVVDGDDRPAGGRAFFCILKKDLR